MPAPYPLLNYALWCEIVTLQLRLRDLERRLLDGPLRPGWAPAPARPAAADPGSPPASRGTPAVRAAGAGIEDWLAAYV